jgi:hypothetical protein
LSASWSRFITALVWIATRPKTKKSKKLAKKAKNCQNWDKAKTRPERRELMTDKDWQQLNSGLLTATLMIAIILGSLLWEPVASAIEYLATN